MGRSTPARVSIRSAARVGLMPIGTLVESAELALVELGLRVAFVADDEETQVRIGPAHRRLNDPVQTDRWLTRAGSITLPVRTG